MAKEEEVRFGFTAGDLATDRRGRADCNICYRPFVVPEVELMLNGFTICPSCVLSGPSAVAAEAERTAGSKKRIDWWEEKNPEDRRGIEMCYREVAKGLRQVDSLEEIPGGVLAVAIAKVTAKPGPPRIRKAT